MIEYETQRTVVSCQGDIAVGSFTRDGVGWLRLGQGPPGEVGRPLGTNPINLSTCSGVLIGARDPRSLDVIIRAATQLRNLLAEELRGEDGDDAA